MDRPMKFRGRKYYEHIHATLEERLGFIFEETESRRVADKIIDEIVTEQVNDNSNVLMGALKSSFGAGLLISAYFELQHYQEFINDLYTYSDEPHTWYKVYLAAKNLISLPLEIVEDSFCDMPILYPLFSFLHKRENEVIERFVRKINFSVSSKPPRLHIVGEDIDVKEKTFAPIKTYEQAQRYDYTQFFRHTVLDDLPVNEHTQRYAKFIKTQKIVIGGIGCLGYFSLGIYSENYFVAALFGSVITAYAFLGKPVYYRLQIARKLDHAVKFYSPRNDQPLDTA